MILSYTMYYRERGKGEYRMLVLPEVAFIFKTSTSIPEEDGCHSQVCSSNQVYKENRFLQCCQVIRALYKICGSGIPWASWPWSVNSLLGQNNWQVIQQVRNTSRVAGLAMIFPISIAANSLQNHTPTDSSCQDHLLTSLPCTHTSSHFTTTLTRSLIIYVRKSPWGFLSGWWQCLE